MKTILFALISKAVIGVAQFSIQLGDPTINTATAATVYIYPSSPTLYVETSITITFPAHLGMTYNSATAVCSEMPASLTTSNYISRTPICTFSTDPATDDILLKISNLRTTGTPQPSYYGLYFTGLVTGPAARSDQISGAGGTYATTYVSAVAKESINANNYVFYPVYKSSGVSVTASPAQNNVQGTMTISFQVDQPIVTTGSLTITLPYQNYQYSGLGITPVRSMVTATITPTGSYTTGSSTVTISPTITTVQQTTQTLLIVMLKNSAIIPAGSVLTIVLSKLLMPPSLAPFSGINIWSGDADLYVIEQIDNLSMTNTLPGTEYTTSFTSSASITTLTGVLESDQTYSFKVYLTGDMPMNSYFTLSVPSLVGMPSAGVSGLSMTCQQYCDASTIVISYASNLLTFNNVVPTESDYIAAPGALQFQLTGFTNPASTESAYFIFTSYAVLSIGTYMIDQISSMHINAEQGICTVTSFIPGDGNYQIYGVASMWNVTMYCEHAYLTTFGVKIAFPSDWYVIDTSACLVYGQSTNYKCVGSSSSNTVTITNLFKQKTTKNQVISFQFTSVRNPTMIGQAYSIDFSVLSSAGGVVDSGSYAFAKTLIVKGTVLSFTVVPQNFGVGQYPVNYTFAFQPSGEMYKGAYIVLTLPDQVAIYSQLQLETFCSQNISGFTTTRINCKLNGNKLTINTGFTYEATSTMLTQNLMVPPKIKFTIPQFWNYRTMATSGAFNLQVFASSNVEIYTWNQTKQLTINGVTVTNITKGPCVQMRVAATPQRVIINRASTVNGAITDYNITVTTTNYLVEGDQIIITLPSPVFFSETSRCLGMSNNLRINQTYTVSVGLNSMQITLLLPLSFRILQAGSTKKIAAGESFTFTLTQVKNSYTTAPTDTSVIYSSYTSGSLMEQMSSGLILQNTLPGTFDANQTSILPQDFRQNYSSNYTLSFQPVNYQQSMVIVVTLPPQITTSGVQCIGLRGTDTPDLNCSLNPNKTMINVTNAVQFQSGNPYLIKIMFNAFTNPGTNLVTDSFQLRTYSHQGWILDSVTTGLSVNFFCQYPCASCDKLSKSQCQSCYGGSDYQYWFDSRCLAVCPASFTNTSSNNCTSCLAPCDDCSSPTECLSCLPGYKLVGTKCQALIYWPFPYVFLSIVFFIIILCSEICTKKESKFKESLIALVSLAEVGAWVTYLVFHYLRKGFDDFSFIFGAAALLCYIMINTIHAFVHPRSITSQSPMSYKALSSNHRCNTGLVRAISYLFSFKYSLLLVSHLCMQSKYKGDYNEINYNTFYKFSLGFILIPYPLMMFSCGYYLYTDGLFSYTSFTAIEVIAISTLLACIMLLDSISVFKFGKGSKKQKGIKVAGDYESDLENDQRFFKAKKGEGLDFGRDGDDDESGGLGLVRRRDDESFVNAGMVDVNIQKQMQLLEELARQMRIEKQQLRLERDRIEMERKAYSESQHRDMQSYLNDDSYSRMTGADNVQSMLRVQEQPSGQKRQYFDVENELIEEEQPSDQCSEESMFIDCVQMPMPVTGTVAISQFSDVFYKEPGQAYLSQSVQSSIQNEMMFRTHSDEGTRSDQLQMLNASNVFSTNTDKIQVQDQLHSDSQITDRKQTSLHQVHPIPNETADSHLSGFNSIEIHPNDLHQNELSQRNHPQTDFQLNAKFSVISGHSINQDEAYLPPQQVSRLRSEQSFYLQEMMLPDPPAVFETQELTLSHETQFMKREQAHRDNSVVKQKTYLQELNQQALQSDSQTSIGMKGNDQHYSEAEISLNQNSFEIVRSNKAKTMKNFNQGLDGEPVRQKKLTFRDDTKQGSQKSGQVDQLKYLSKKGSFELIDNTDEQQDDGAQKSQSQGKQRSNQVKRKETDMEPSSNSLKNSSDLVGQGNASSDGDSFGDQGRLKQSKTAIKKTNGLDEDRDQSQDNIKRQKTKSAKKEKQSYESGVDYQEDDGTQHQESYKRQRQKTELMKEDIKLSQSGVNSHNADDQNQVDLKSKNTQLVKSNQNLAFKEGREGKEDTQLGLANDDSQNKYHGAKTAKYATKMLDYNKDEIPETGKDPKTGQPNVLEQEQSYGNLGQSVQMAGYTKGSKKSLTKSFTTLKDFADQDVTGAVAESRGTESRYDLKSGSQFNDQRNGDQDGTGVASDIQRKSEKGRQQTTQNLLDQQKKEGVESESNSLSSFEQKAGNLNNQGRRTSRTRQQQSESRNEIGIDGQEESDHTDSRPDLKQENRPLDTKFAKVSMNQTLQSNDQFEVLVNEADEARERMQKHYSLAEYRDSSGHSESSEGIVDHNPFTSAGFLIKPPKEYAQQKVVPVSKAKQIIYSDKSESSVEEMMGDTPSNYNIPNGRLDGKSAGLKPIVALQQQQPSNQLALPPKPPLAQMISGKRRTSEGEELKFVSQMESSREGGWGNVNQPIGKRVMVIAEDSGDEVLGHRKKKAIKTNKQFAESFSRNQKQSKTPAPAVRQQNQLHNEIRKNNFI